MKITFCRAAILIAVSFLLLPAARAQFEAQDNYWLERNWTHGQTLNYTDYAFGMAADSTGRLYIATGSKILVYNSSGTLTQQWNVTDVQDVALYPGSNILATCSFNTSANPIKIYDTNGTFIRQWGVSGTATGQLLNPASVAIGSDGLVYVGDISNSRIQVFDLSGNFVRTWGQSGAAGGQFNHPRSVRLGVSNTVYVADFFNNRVQFFDLNGNFIRQYQDSASGWSPKAVVISPDNAIIFTLDSGTASGRRTLTPDGQLVASSSSASTYGSVWSPDGQYLYFLTNTQVQRFRRGFRTFGTKPPNAIPLPGVLGVAQRAGTGLFDIDYQVIDPDNSTVQVGALAFMSGRRDLAAAIPMTTLAEGTASALGTNITTGARHHLTWDAGTDWPTNQGNVSITILAKDNRGLMDFHFITIPSNATYATPLTVSQSPVAASDFLNVWTWLVATADTNIICQTGNVYGVSGSYSNVLLAQTIGTSTSTTTNGRAFLWSLMGVREATTNELFRAAMGTTGRVTQWQPRLQISGTPAKINEYGFDTGAFSTSLPFVPVTNVWWVVPSP